MAKLIDTNTTYNNSSGTFKRGLSAYQVWLTEGNLGDPQDFLESLKAFSPIIGEMTQTDNGITFTITDENGEHPVVLRNGLDITIESTEVTEEDETIITFSDGTLITIPPGVTGPQGENGHEIILSCDSQGIVYWRYTGDMNQRQLIDLGTLARNKFAQEFESHQLIMLVDELPDPQDAVEGVIYILREEV